MGEPESRKERRDRHAREVEDSQQSLRNNIAEADRLLKDSDKLLKRHREERDEHDD